MRAPHCEPASEPQRGQRAHGRRGAARNHCHNSIRAARRETVEDPPRMKLSRCAASSALALAPPMADARIAALTARRQRKGIMKIFPGYGRRHRIILPGHGIDRPGGERQTNGIGAAVAAAMTTPER